MGTHLAMLLLCEGWAEPIVDEEPALVIPVSEARHFSERIAERQPSPPNLVREHYPPYSEQLAVAADLERRKRRGSES